MVNDCRTCRRNNNGDGECLNEGCVQEWARALSAESGWRRFDDDGFPIYPPATSCPGWEGKADLSGLAARDQSVAPTRSSWQRDVKVMQLYVYTNVDDGRDVFEDNVCVGVKKDGLQLGFQIHDREVAEKLAADVLAAAEVVWPKIGPAEPDWKARALELEGIRIEQAAKIRRLIDRVHELEIEREEWNVG